MHVLSFGLRFGFKSEEEFHFQYWNENDSLNYLMDYVKDVTDENSKNFIPAEDRIAVFDMNGTIYCETDPFYLEVLLLMARFQDDRYTPSQEVQELIRALMGESDDGFALEGSQFERIYGEAFAGMTLKEYETFVKDFIE